jgi:hypothetical protein
MTIGTEQCTSCKNCVTSSGKVGVNSVCSNSTNYTTTQCTAFVNLGSVSTSDAAFSTYAASIAALCVSLAIAMKG